MIFSDRRKISAKFLADKEKSDAKCSNLTKLIFTHPLTYIQQDGTQSSRPCAADYHHSVPVIYFYC